MGEEVRKLVAGLRSGQVNVNLFCAQFKKLVERRVLLTRGNVLNQLNNLRQAIDIFSNVRLSLPNTKLVEEIGIDLFLKCARTILSYPYLAAPAHLEVGYFQVSINRAEKLLQESGYGHRFNMLKWLLKYDWRHPILRRLFMGARVDQDCGVSYVKIAEFPELLKLRVELLMDDDCPDFALNLCMWCLENPKLKSDPFLRSVQLMLLHMRGLTEFFYSQCHLVPCCVAVQVLDHIEPAARNSSAFMSLAQTLMLQDWLKPYRFCCTKRLVAHWLEVEYENEMSPGDVEFAVRCVADLSTETYQLMILVHQLNEMFGKDCIQLHLDLCLLALKRRLHEIETCDIPEEAKLQQRQLIDHHSSITYICTSLSNVCAGWSRKLRSIAMLTAFSLEPRRDILMALDVLYGDEGGVTASSASGQDRSMSESAESSALVPYASAEHESQDGRSEATADQSIAGVSPYTLMELLKTLDCIRSPELDPTLPWELLKHVCTLYLEQQGEASQADASQDLLGLNSHRVQTAADTTDPLDVLYKTCAESDLFASSVTNDSQSRRLLMAMPQVELLSETASVDSDFESALLLPSIDVGIKKHFPAHINWNEEEVASLADSDVEDTSSVSLESTSDLSEAESPSGSESHSGSESGSESMESQDLPSPCPRTLSKNLGSVESIECQRAASVESSAVGSLSVGPESIDSTTLDSLSPDVKSVLSPDAKSKSPEPEPVPSPHSMSPQPENEVAPSEPVQSPRLEEHTVLVDTVVAYTAMIESAPSHVAQRGARTSLKNVGNRQVEEHTALIEGATVELVPRELADLKVEITKWSASPASSCDSDQEAIVLMEPCAQNISCHGLAEPVIVEDVSVSKPYQDKREVPHTAAQDMSLKASADTKTLNSTDIPKFPSDTIMHTSNSTKPAQSVETQNQDKQVEDLHPSIVPKATQNVSSIAKLQELAASLPSPEDVASTITTASSSCASPMLFAALCGGNAAEAGGPLATSSPSQSSRRTMKPVLHSPLESYSHVPKIASGPTPLYDQPHDPVQPFVAPPQPTRVFSHVPSSPVSVLGPQQYGQQHTLMTTQTSPPLLAVSHPTGVLTASQGLVASPQLAGQTSSTMLAISQPNYLSPQQPMLVSMNQPQPILSPVLTPGLVGSQVVTSPSVLPTMQPAQPLLGQVAQSPVMMQPQSPGIMMVMSNSQPRMLAPQTMAAPIPTSSPQSAMHLLQQMSCQQQATVPGQLTATNPGFMLQQPDTAALQLPHPHTPSLQLPSNTLLPGTDSSLLPGALQSGNTPTMMANSLQSGVASVMMPSPLATGSTLPMMQSPLQPTPSLMQQDLPSHCYTSIQQGHIDSTSQLAVNGGVFSQLPVSNAMLNQLSTDHGLIPQQPVVGSMLTQQLTDDTVLSSKMTNSLMDSNKISEHSAGFECQMINYGQKTDPRFDTCCGMEPAQCKCQSGSVPPSNNQSRVTSVQCGSTQNVASVGAPIADVSAGTECLDSTVSMDSSGVEISIESLPPQAGMEPREGEEYDTVIYTDAASQTDPCEEDEEGYEASAVPSWQMDNSGENQESYPQNSVDTSNETTEGVHVTGMESAAQEGTANSVSCQENSVGELMPKESYGHPQDSREHLESFEGLEDISQLEMTSETSLKSMQDTSEMMEGAGVETTRQTSICNTSQGESEAGFDQLNAVPTDAAYPSIPEVTTAPAAEDEEYDYSIPAQHKLSPYPKVKEMDAATVQRMKVLEAGVMRAERPQESTTRTTSPIVRKFFTHRDSQRTSASTSPESQVRSCVEAKDSSVDTKAIVNEALSLLASKGEMLSFDGLQSTLVNLIQEKMNHNGSKKKGEPAFTVSSDLKSVTIALGGGSGKNPIKIQMMQKNSSPAAAAAKGDRQQDASTSPTAGLTAGSTTKPESLPAELQRTSPKPTTKITVTVKKGADKFTVPLAAPFVTLSTPVDEEEHPVPAPPGQKRMSNRYVYSGKPSELLAMCSSARQPKVENKPIASVRVMSESTVTEQSVSSDSMSTDMTPCNQSPSSVQLASTIVSSPTTVLHSNSQTSSHASPKKRSMSAESHQPVKKSKPDKEENLTKDSMSTESYQSVKKSKPDKEENLTKDSISTESHQSVKKSKPDKNQNLTQDSLSTNCSSASRRESNQSSQSGEDQQNSGIPDRREDGSSHRSKDTASHIEGKQDVHKKSSSSKSHSRDRSSHSHKSHTKSEHKDSKSERSKDSRKDSSGKSHRRDSSSSRKSSESSSKSRHKHSHKDRSSDRSSKSHKSSHKSHSRDSVSGDKSGHRSGESGKVSSSSKKSENSHSKSSSRHDRKEESSKSRKSRRSSSSQDSCNKQAEPSSVTSTSTHSKKNSDKEPDILSSRKTDAESKGKSGDSKSPVKSRLRDKKYRASYWEDDYMITSSGGSDAESGNSGQESENIKKPSQAAGRNRDDDASSESLPVKRTTRGDSTSSESLSVRRTNRSSSTSSESMAEKQTAQSGSTSSEGLPGRRSTRASSCTSESKPVKRTFSCDSTSDTQQTESQPHAEGHIPDTRLTRRSGRRTSTSPDKSRTFEVLDEHMNQGQVSTSSSSLKLHVNNPGAKENNGKDGFFKAFADWVSVSQGGNTKSGAEGTKLHVDSTLPKSEGHSDTKCPSIETIRPVNSKSSKPVPTPVPPRTVHPARATAAKAPIDKLGFQNAFSTFTKMTEEEDVLEYKPTYMREYTPWFQGKTYQHKNGQKTHSSPPAKPKITKAEEQFLKAFGQTSENMRGSSSEGNDAAAEVSINPPSNNTPSSKEVQAKQLNTNRTQNLENSGKPCSKDADESTVQNSESSAGNQPGGPSLAIKTTKQEKSEKPALDSSLLSYRIKTEVTNATVKSPATSPTSKSPATVRRPSVEDRVVAGNILSLPADRKNIARRKSLDQPSNGPISATKLPSSPAEVPVTRRSRRGSVSTESNQSDSRIETRCTQVPASKTCVTRKTSDSKNSDIDVNGDDSVSENECQIVEDTQMRTRRKSAIENNVKGHRNLNPVVVLDRTQVTRQLSQRSITTRRKRHSSDSSSCSKGSNASENDSSGSPQMCTRSRRCSDSLKSEVVASPMRKRSLRGSTAEDPILLETEDSSSGESSQVVVSASSDRGRCTNSAQDKSVDKGSPSSAKVQRRTRSCSIDSESASSQSLSSSQDDILSENSSRTNSPTLTRETRASRHKKVNSDMVVLSRSGTKKSDLISANPERSSRSTSRDPEWELSSLERSSRSRSSSRGPSPTPTWRSPRTRKTGQSISCEAVGNKRQLGSPSSVSKKRRSSDVPAVVTVPPRRVSLRETKSVWEREFLKSFTQ